MMSESDDKIHTTDYAFGQAVMRAGRSFVAAKGKEPAIEGADLAAMLRGGMPLGPGEREELAQLVTVEWRRRAGEAGKARKVHPETPEVIAVDVAYQEAIASNQERFGRDYPENARQAVADQFSISKATVKNYVEMRQERQEAIREVKARAPIT